jgi:hypothetical protein
VGVDRQDGTVLNHRFTLPFLLFFVFFLSSWIDMHWEPLLDRLANRG